MSDLLEKISSYNIFNYLLPGTLFAAAAAKYTSHGFSHDNVLIAAFLYYFIGLVISRIGSLLIEPWLRKVQFVPVGEYSKFVAASKADDKIAILSEVNNMYRTLSALLVCVFAYVLFDRVAVAHPWIDAVAPYFAGVLLLILFLLSWRKQNAYINKRIDASRKP